MSIDRCCRLLGWVLGLAVAACGGTALAELPIEREPINYFSAKATDPIARLQERIDRAEVVLAHEEERGYLKSVLKTLNVPESSQSLVFSKTSFQHTRIAPRTPRALYFNDDVYVGFVRAGDVLEFASIDPRLGTVFYLLDQAKADKPVFQRATHDCLQCHHSTKTEEVPGVLVRSLFPNRVGTPVFSAGSFVTTHESPMKERWGGWYVTGTHGRQRHMGNVVLQSQNPDHLDREDGANVLDLKGRVDTTPYLTRHSDIVALMVLEHQTQLHNLITRLNYETRTALCQEGEINKAFGRPAGSVSEGTEHRVRSYAQNLVKYMLFTEEAPLTDPVTGTSGFTEEFASRGPRDRKGRSLRDFDLQKRLFKYPCSYLVHSEGFDALPVTAKDEVYRQLREILTGASKAPEYARLTAEDRLAIFEILIDTKPDLPKAWKDDLGGAGGMSAGSGGD